MVNVKDFGAKGDGVTNDTLSIQAALNSGAKTVYIPDGVYPCSLIMPSTVGLTLHGNGTGSILKQIPSGPVIRFPAVNGTSDNFYMQGFIKDLLFDGTYGLSHTLDTSFAGGVTLETLYFKNTPKDFASVYINGTATVYTHDIRINGLQVYSDLPGDGVIFGPTAADCSLVDFIMNGNFKSTSGVKLLYGASSVRLSQCHIYNTIGSVLKLQGNNTGFSANDCVFDNCYADIATLIGTRLPTFINCRFQAVNIGKSGVSLTDCLHAKFIGCNWDGATGAFSAVSEKGVTDETSVIGSVVDNAVGFTKLYDFVGKASSVSYSTNGNPRGATYVFSGTGTTHVSPNSTQYIGANANQLTSGATNWVVPFASLVKEVSIYTETTPGVGQSYNFSVIRNGAAIASGTIINGGYSLVLYPNLEVSKADTLSIKVTTSIAANPVLVRISMVLTG